MNWIDLYVTTRKAVFKLLENKYKTFSCPSWPRSEDTHRMQIPVKWSYFLQSYPVFPWMKLTFKRTRGPKGTNVCQLDLLIRVAFAQTFLLTFLGIDTLWLMVQIYVLKTSFSKFLFEYLKYCQVCITNNLRFK